MAFLTQLKADQTKYRQLLVDYMEGQKDGRDGQFVQLSTIDDTMDPADFAEVCERNSGRTLMLGYPRKAGEEVEEVILRVQGFLQDAHLPPIRSFHIPRNHARLMDLKQSVTLIGFGAERFDCAVRGLGSIYQFFKRHVARSGSRLRDWTPGRDGANLTLMFANRYLSSSRDAAGESPADLAEIVDPFNILRPLLQTEVHTQDNVVEYWQRHEDENERFARIKPEAFSISNMVEVQIGFIAVKTGRTEYVFLPKLRSVCLLNRAAEKDYNIVAIRSLSLQKRVSPLKKVKRKVGYGEDPSEPCLEAGPPQDQMKRLRLEDQQRGEGEQEGEAMVE